MIELLGTLGALGLIAFYIPQMLSVWRAERLEGFNLWAWVALLSGGLFLFAQAMLMRVWSLMVLDAVCCASTAEMIRQIVKKQ